MIGNGSRPGLDSRGLHAAQRPSPPLAATRVRVFIDWVHAALAKALAERRRVGLHCRARHDVRWCDGVRRWQELIMHVERHREGPPLAAREWVDAMDILPAGGEDGGAADSWLDHEPWDGRVVQEGELLQRGRSGLR